jgi:hypothetical protein
MVQRYTHATEKSQREAAARIDREILGDELPQFEELEDLARVFRAVREGDMELEDFIAAMTGIPSDR